MIATEWYKNKKILVTGGAGFIGSHLVETLLQSGADVTVLDNFSTGTHKNLAPFQKDITLIEGNIEDYKTCKKATSGQNVIFHLAAFACIPTSFDDPQQCYITNALGTFNLLESARKSNTQKFIFSSSCAVYGSTTKPCSELMDCNPMSPYGYSKLSSELYCRQYAKLFGMETLCLRYFNVFGSRQSTESPYGGVVAKFREAMKKNESIIIFGDGSQSRDFVSVQEVVSANITLALLSHKELNGQSVNIGTGLSETILDLFTKLKKEYNYTKNPIFMPTRQGDVTHSASNAQKYHTLIRSAYITHTTI